MALNFNQYAADANTFLNEYAWHMSLEDEKDRAGRIFTAILHALRDLITPEESVQLIAQLPMFVKAVYVNGWSIKKARPKVKTIKDFIELVRKHDGPSANADFEYSDELAEHYIDATLIFLRKYVSQGEMEDIRDVLPKDLKALIHTRLPI